MHEFLNNDNFLIYCAKHYNSKTIVDDKEFLQDINRIKYIKKLLTRYILHKDLKERLILNHIIILNNIFGPFHSVRILYCKFEKEFKYIKPFLIMLNILPETIINVLIQNNVIYTDEIQMDNEIINKLRTI